MLVTFVFFTLFPVTLLWAHNFAWLALAFVVRGLKEFGKPARWAHFGFGSLYSGALLSGLELQ